MKRVGSMITLQEDKKQKYIELHANAWPNLLELISECNINNYTIFLCDRENLLFSYFEYLGEEYERDMQKLADNPITQEWWALCMPCQSPLPSSEPGEWWSVMREVFRLD